MKMLLYTDKKGLTEMLSYVLLVIIAVGLSALVFTYLSVYVPKDTLQCSEDISLSLQDYSCKINPGGGADLTINLANKGLFKIDAVYLRISKPDRRIGELINNPEGDINTGHCSFFLADDCTNPSNQGLSPSKTFTHIYTIPSKVIPSAGSYSLEIQPATFVKDELALCSNAVIVQPITCN